MIPLQESYSPQTLTRYCISYTRFSSQAHSWREIMKLLMVVLLTAAAATGVGCGYSSHATTPQQPGTVPAIATLVPPSTAAGSSQFTLEVDGSNFGGSAIVKFNGAAMSTTFVSSTKVMATIPASAVATSNPAVPVTVTNPGTPGGQYGGGTAPATSTPMDFTIN
jgi:hypothetical protein